MTETRTIFLAIDGRYTTLGRGTVEPGKATLDGIAEAGLVGWVATMTGTPHARRVPTLTAGQAFNGADASQWGLAVQSFNAAHAAKQGV